MNPSDKFLGSDGLESTSAISSGTEMQMALFEPHDEDSIERETVLGMHLTNPYLKTNMQQAYTHFGLDANKAVINNLYVRFLPADVGQLRALDSIMEANGLELFDTPADYEVLYEGDYYQDPSVPDENITWQYAVVPPSFSFPAGIQHETLAQIHIPEDGFTEVETEAERLAAIQDSAIMANAARGGGVHPNVLQCDPGYEWSFTLHKCVPILDPQHPCPLGYHWDDDLQTCVSDNPPGPAPDAAKPAGSIYVHDTNLDSDVPVRKARVVAKRWFKIERTFTDDNGHFQFTKRFKHKVKINVKFKNEYAQIRKLRGVRLWQMLFPIKATLGVFSGDKSAIERTFITYTDRGAKGNSYWVGATALNAAQEYRTFASAENIGLPPQGLKIILTNWGGGGSAPMFAKRAVNDLPAEFITSFLGAPVAIVAGVAFVLKQQIDITASYSFARLATMESDRVKETMYHELTHAAHYQKLGNAWYTTFVNMVLMANVSNLLSGYAPYGDGTNPTFSPIIALGEGWAYYIGHYMANLQYGITASCQSEQDNLPGTVWCGTHGTHHPHLDVLEHFNPNLTADRFEWIPQGLFYDLWDPANELKPSAPVDDNVAGYSNAQMFNAFSNNIYNLQVYKTNLLAITSNPTSINVSQLFAEYHY